MPGPTEAVVISFVRVLMQGLDLNEEQRSVLLQPDRAMSCWRMSVGYTGTRQRVMKIEETGEQNVVLHGKDADGNIDPLRTRDKKLTVEVS